MIAHQDETKQHVLNKGEEFCHTFQSVKLHFLFCYMGHDSPNIYVPLHLPSYCLLLLKCDPFVKVHWVYVMPSRDCFLLAETFFSSKARKEKVSNI